MPTHPWNRPLVDILSRNFHTPLMYAAWGNHADVVKALLAAGAKLNTRSLIMGVIDPYIGDCPNGSTALHMAANNGAELAAEAIIAHYVRVEMWG